MRLISRRLSPLLLSAFVLIGVGMLATSWTEKPQANPPNVVLFFS